VRISSVVDDLAADLAALGALGNEATAEAAGRLAGAMKGPMTARLLDVLGQAAAELGASLPAFRVEVRLVGGDAELVVDANDPPAPGDLEPEGEADARITLRLSAQLKARVEAASARDGVSVNTYVVRALNQQARAEQPWSVQVTKGGHRLRGYGRS
jgi:hypothetical protein